MVGGLGGGELLFVFLEDFIEAADLFDEFWVSVERMMSSKVI